MTKAPADIRSLARAHTATCIRRLAWVATKSKSDSAVVAACDALLNRGWGKASQPITGKDEEPLGVEVALLTPVEREQRIAALKALVLAQLTKGVVHADSANREIAGPDAKAER